MRFLPTFQRALAIIALAAGITSVPALPAFAAGSWQANDDDAVLLDIRSGQYRVGSSVRGYQTNNGVCVDFADIIMSLDLPVRLDKKSRRATGWLFEEQRIFTLDRDSNIVQIMNKLQSLAAEDLYDTPEGWCVNTKTLARWFAVDIQPDLFNAVLILKADRKLPFELAEERKVQAGKVRQIAQFDLSNLPQAKDPYKLWRTPSIDVVASVGGRRDSLGGTRFDARYEVYASGELAGASVDARLSSNQRGVPDRLRVRAYRSDPNGKLLGPLNATHFALGDVSTVSTPLGSQNNVGRGAFVTNRPLERADSFDKTTFRGDLPDGWDAELYRNSQLIGYMQSRGDGRYEFIEVPLQFGQNRFEVVLYGPQGQVRRDVRLIPVGPDSIPPRETYYWAGVQDAGQDLINFGDDEIRENAGWRGGFGFERGIDAKTSVGGSYSTAALGGLRNHYLEGSLRRALGPALVEFSAASNLRQGFAIRGQALAQVGETALSVESVLFRGGFQSERLEANLASLHSVSVDQTFKIGGARLPVHLNARRITRVNGDRSIESSAKLYFNINTISATTELIWENQKRAFGTDPPDRLDAVLRLSGHIGGLRLRGESTYGLIADRGIRESKLTAEWTRDDNSRWRATMGYDAKNSVGRFSGGYTRQFEKFALSSELEAATNGAVTAGISLAFSLGPKPTGGIRVAAEKLASAGQAMAIVYYDENADGIRQDNEPLEKAVELTAGISGRGKPTDANGTTFIDGLQPFKPILIGIDASSLPDPFVQPASSGIVVTPRPGVPLTIELPLVAAGEISGSLAHEGGKILSGVDLDLLDRNGRVVKTTRTEYDGFFLFTSVPYGQYQMRINALSAAVIGVKPELSQTAALTRNSSSVDVGVIVASTSTRIADISDKAGTD